MHSSMAPAMRFEGFAADGKKKERILKRTWINKDYGAAEETAKEAYRIKGEEDIWTDACSRIESIP